MVTELSPATGLLENQLPDGAPGFLCPSCGCELKYVGSRSNAAGSNPIDLSDFYRCPEGCGTYEHERKRHRIRVVE